MHAHGARIFNSIWTLKFSKNETLRFISYHLPRLVVVPFLQKFRHQMPHAQYSWADEIKFYDKQAQAFLSKLLAKYFPSVFRFFKYFS